MKKLSIITLMVLLLFNNTAEAQDEGIRFQTATNWQQVLDKAKQENKYIFVDCYATWCGPCKAMDATIFPDKEVGQFFNDRFISVKVQMDKTPKDAPFIKGWYKDAKMLESKYSVNSYPTYLFFSPEGKPLHRFTGGSSKPADFIAKAKQALDPARQYYATVFEYKKHLKDSAFLRNAIRVALDQRDRKTAADIGNAYLDIVNPFLKENIHVIRSVTLSTRDRGFGILMKHAGKIDSIMGNKVAALVIGSAMYEDELRPYMETDKTIKDWNKMATRLKREYYPVDTMQIDSYEHNYYYAKNNIPAYEKALLKFMENYEHRLKDYDYNNSAWSVFKTSDRTDMLEAALKWSEKSLDMVNKSPGSNYCNYLDTHASLLHKLGRKQEAIQFARKTIDVAIENKNEKAIAAYKQKLTKIEKGEKTW